MHSSISCFSLIVCFGFYACSNGHSQDDLNQNQHEFDSSGPIVQWSVKPTSRYILNKRDESFYLYIPITTGTKANTQKRVPLNLSLVLDRSGSMGGDKIEYAREAAKFVVDQLSSEDYLSIVNYDDEVQVTSVSQEVKNKEILKRAIDKLFARGSTNLSGGLLEGYSQVKRTTNPNYVNRVLILTDGLANQGIVEPAALKQLVSKKYGSDGTALSTFGLGADYDENLLTMLAETGHANYHFIDKPDNIPALFASELKGLLNVVAQSAMVQIELPAGIACENVFGYQYEIKENKVSIRLNDLYANDQKSLLLKLKPSSAPGENLNITCRLSYINTEDFSEALSSKQVSLKYTSNQDVVTANEDKEALESVALFEASEEFDEVMTRVDANQYEPAKQRGSMLISKLKSKQAKLNSEKLQKQLIELEGYVNGIDSVRRMKDEERSLFQKSSKAKNYSIKKTGEVKR